MGSTFTDVVVHVTEHLDQEAVLRLEQSLSSGPGVVAVGHRPGQHHLLTVVYDSAVTRAVDLLQPIRQRGLHAQLVGL
jgi:hypothetical protein